MSRGVLLQRVVHRRVEVALAAVVVDAEAAAAIEVAHVGAEQVQLDEDAAGLAERVLHGADVGDLRADVEVEQLQAVEHLLGAEPLDGGHGLGGREAELRAVAGRLDPLAGTFGREARAYADHRTDLELARGAQNGLELADLIDDDDHLAAELLRQQRRLDVGAIFVAVAEDQRLGVVLEGEGDEQLRLRAGLDAEVVGPPVLHQLLDDVPLLVHLDRVDAAIGAAVVVLGDRLLERAAELLHARAQDVREADEEGQVEAAATQVVDQLLQVDPYRAVAGGRHLDVAGLVDAEEVATPAADVVQLDRVVDRPRAEFFLRCDFLQSGVGLPVELDKCDKYPASPSVSRSRARTTLHSVVHGEDLGLRRRPTRAAPGSRPPRPPGRAGRGALSRRRGRRT